MQTAAKLPKAPMLTFPARQPTVRSNRFAHMRKTLKKVLVIGGSGFVGKALVPALQTSNFDVSVLNRGTRAIEGVSQVIADRDDPQSLSRHAAAYDVVIDTSGYTRLQVENAFSVFGDQAGKWIHLSSAAVYRETPDRLPKEEDALGGAAVWGPYGADKSDADEFLLGQAQGPLVILRPPYLYGPNNSNDRETFVWSRVLSGRPVIVPGDGSAQIQFLHVRDLAHIFVHLAEADTGMQAVYNVAEPETMTARSWVERVAAAAGSEPEILCGRTHANGLAARKYFPFRDYPCALDVERFVRDLDWKFEFSFDDGIRDTFLSYDPDALKTYSPSSREERHILDNR